MEPMENDLVILSIVGHYNEIVNLISAVMCEKSEKPSFFDVFWTETYSFSSKVAFFVFGAPFPGEWVTVV